MTKRVVVVDEEGVVQKRYAPVSQQNQNFAETFLQKLIFEEPKLLPTEEIGSDYANLIPLCRELPVKSGSIDVVYLTIEGKICLVETKLWRNPEAHRTVVAQIIDYAKDLSRWSFADFCEGVTRVKGEDASREALFKKIRQKQPEFDGIKLQKNIQQALSHGHFLLLIVGNKIFPEVALLTESIHSAPHLEFTIRLIELEFFNVGVQEDKQLLVIPQVVGKTYEQTRAIVRIVYEEKKPEVSVTPVESDKSLIDQDTFFKDLDSDGLAVFKAILKLSDLHGFPIHWGTKGFSLNVDIDGIHVALCYGYGLKARGGQLVWTAFTDIINKVKDGEFIVKDLRQQLRPMNIFTETQKEMKFNFQKKINPTQITELADILVDLANKIESNGLL
jgi:hypothetical protein